MPRQETIKPKIECAYCNGTAYLRSNDRELTYRKETLKVLEHFYKCAACLEEFTTEETDTLTMLQIGQLNNPQENKSNLPN